MNTRTQIRRRLVLLGVSLSLAGCTAEAPSEDVDLAAQALVKCPPDVPASLDVPEGNRVGFIAYAEGVQRYVCQNVDGVYTWVFVGPVADLYKQNGQIFGSHYRSESGPPAWEAVDGSTVLGTLPVGEVVASTAIPWLRLTASHAVGDNKENGRMGRVTYIQRVDTAGGLAPAEGCSSDDDVNQGFESEYTATYYFYVPAPGASQGQECEAHPGGP